MSLINHYVPAAPPPKPTEYSAEPYKFSWNNAFPSCGFVASQKVKLVPFIPAVHGPIFHAQYTPAVDKYIPVEWLDRGTFIRDLEGFFAAPEQLLLAIIDTTKCQDGDDNLQESLAGMIGLMRSAPASQSAEMGPVIILPKFQRTHVSTHAIGLLLKYTLDLPEHGGIAYRRVTWICGVENEASKRAALRMGFKEEGVMRWFRNVSGDLTGNKEECGVAINQSRGRGIARGMHGVLLALCWDEWEDSGRLLVEKQMSRV